MPTFGEAISALEDQLFVGRERELATFGEWLAADCTVPDLLNVSGRGGIGKSALVRAFARHAQRQGRPVVLLDSRDFPHTPDGFLGAIAGPSAADPLDALNDTRPLLLLDTFEELGELNRYLQTRFLPALDAEVKVVLAGRYPLGLAWSVDSPWRGAVRPLPLDALSPEAAREYLRRRGVIEPQLVERVLAVAAGSPLVLGLAADMAAQFGVRDFTLAPEWRLVVRTLVEQLLREVADPRLRALLDACSVVRQFDEPLIAALTDDRALGSAFDQLCHLTVVRPTEHGLMLHDELRRALAEDLRWRDPERYNRLRVRAMAYYQERMRGAKPPEREWLLLERLYLWGHAIIQRLMFAEDEPGQVWIEPGGPEDRATLVPLTVTWVREYLSREIEVDFNVIAAGAYLQRLLNYPDAIVRVARNQDGCAVGYTMAVPVCQESFPLLLGHEGWGTVLQTLWPEADRASLPPTAATADTLYIIILAAAPEGVSYETVQSVLMRDMLGRITIKEGVILTSVPVPAYKAFFEACGFERIPAARTWAWSRTEPGDSYVLNVRQIGIEAWFEAIVGGRPLPRPLDPAALERALQDALAHWTDDAWLAKSPLADLPAAGAGAPPEAVRALVQAALARARQAARPEQALAYRALELAYLQKTTSHERAAERLAVSVPTFYRLLKRGVAGVARALAEPAPAAAETSPPA